MSLLQRIKYNALIQRRIEENQGNGEWGVIDIHDTVQSEMGIDLDLNDTVLFGELLAFFNGREYPKPPIDVVDTVKRSEAIREKLAHMHEWSSYGVYSTVKQTLGIALDANQLVKVQEYFNLTSPPKRLGVWHLMYALRPRGLDGDTSIDASLISQFYSSRALAYRALMKYVVQREVDKHSLEGAFRDEHYAPYLEEYYLDSVIHQDALSELLTDLPIEQQEAIIGAYFDAEDDGDMDAFWQIEEVAVAA